MNSLLNKIFPGIENKKINNKLKNKTCNLDNEIALIIETYDQKQLYCSKKEDIIISYNNTIDIKNILEDKAKTNLTSFSIVITLMLGLSTIFIENYNNIISFKFYSAIFIVSTISILYFVLATVSLINMLNNENTIYTPNLIEINNEEELIKEYISSIVYNRNNNIIRNNIIYTSYEYIRNGIICLFFIFILIILLTLSNKFKNINGKIDLIETNDLILSEELIESMSTLEDDKEYILINKKNKKIIEIILKDDWFIIKNTK